MTSRMDCCGLNHGGYEGGGMVWRGMLVCWEVFLGKGVGENL